MNHESPHFFEPEAVAATVEQVILAGGFSQEISDFFADERCLDFIEPYPEQSALHVFTTWLACRVLDETTTSVDIAAVSIDPSSLPVDEALKRYGLYEEGFLEHLGDVGKNLSEVEEDDICNYFDELKLSGKVEELGAAMADKVFPILLRNTVVLSAFNDLVADYLKDTKIRELDLEHALFFLSDGQLHDIPASISAKRAVIEATGGKCSKCGSGLNTAASGRPHPHFELFVPVSAGGLNDVSNLAAVCDGCRVRPNEAR
jgi:hypothetical protein